MNLPGFEDALIVGDLGIPMDVAWTPDGRMLIPTKDGQLRVYSAGSLLPTPALDLSGVLCAENENENERALGGIAVHPDFARNHFIYLYHTFMKFGTCNASEVDGPVNRLSRFTLSDDNLVDPHSELVLFDTPPLPTAFHMGGDLKFGRDGYLYATVGDGGSGGSPCCSHPEWPQDPGVLLGKVLRLTDSGGIPPSNPYTGQGSSRCGENGVPPPNSPPGTMCREVYAVGLRNPFRFAFDPDATGVRFFINDVGEFTWEEVSEGEVRADYGWPVMEGPCVKGSISECDSSQEGLKGPVYWYGHNVTANGRGCGAITGGAFVPDGFWPTSYNNDYLFSDFNCGQVWSLRPNGRGGHTRSDLALMDPGLISLRFGPSGFTQALYYVTLASGGQLRRISFTENPDFSIAVNPPGLTMEAGTSAFVNLVLGSRNSFEGPVNFSSTATSGISASVEPVSVDVGAGQLAFSTLYVTAGSSATPGSYHARVTASSAHISVSVGISVVLVPSFRISSPANLSILAGNEGTTSIEVSGDDGFSGVVTLSASSPSGLAVSLDPATLDAFGVSTIRVLVSDDVSPGAYAVTVIALSGSTTRTTSFAVTVPSPPFRTPSRFEMPQVVILGGLGSVGAAIALAIWFSGRLKSSKPGRLAIEGPRPLGKQNVGELTRTPPSTLFTIFSKDLGPRVTTLASKWKLITFQMMGCRILDRPLGRCPD